MKFELPVPRAPAKPGEYKLVPVGAEPYKFILTSLAYDELIVAIFLTVKIPGVGKEAPSGNAGTKPFPNAQAN